MELRNKTKAIKNGAMKQTLNTNEKLKSIRNLFSKNFLAAETRNALKGERLLIGRQRN